MKDKKIVSCLNEILELELAGVVKYTHYAFMVQGPYRLSIVQWLRSQAQESLTHAEAVGEQILGWGGERTKHESVQRRVLIIERDDERECTALRRAS